ncbi:type II toxin-antitoxin system RelE/ParE family toxin [Prosthecobacter sp.]|uniref:type II toxin-antitoxin system RelE/ParE family toxin n=1 Tax=Prosthecobacter sp. TaxID=1965333 RepID=UPI0037832309
MLQPGSYEVLIFRHASEESPYLDWLETLDWKMQERILARVARMKKGQFGDCKSLDRGLYELRLFFGPGYRVYFGEHKGKTVIILGGGDKATQSKDIKRAREYWKTYQEDHP